MASKSARSAQSRGLQRASHGPRRLGAPATHGSLIPPPAEAGPASARCLAHAGEVGWRRWAGAELQAVGQGHCVERGPNLHIIVEVENAPRHGG